MVGVGKGSQIFLFNQTQFCFHGFISVVVVRLIVTLVSTPMYFHHIDQNRVLVGI